MIHSLKQVSDEKGQSMVIVLLLIVIAATIAMAISYRTLQDIRRAGQERMSSKAVAGVESLLDAFTEKEVWDELWESGGLCYQQEGGCLLKESTINNFLGDPDTDCDPFSVSVRIPDDIIGFELTQDDVLEVPLDSLSTAGDFRIGWYDADYLLVKVYTATDIDIGGSGEHVWALTHDNPDGWLNQTEVTAGTTYTIEYSASAVLARIRPIGGDARIDIFDAPPLVGDIKASCYVGDVYREYVREFWLSDFVPACFDYVLFDGTGTVQK
ncbi:MAG: hypothetical protein U9Q67_01400 [Patescibacteria group bacterium]|nr:hypothetical protein [Patescibacteria group bacterium]